MVRLWSVMMFWDEGKASWSTRSRGMRRRLERRLVTSRFITNLLGTVRKLRLLAKTSRRNALAVTAMTDDVTSPTVTSQ